MVLIDKLKELSINQSAMEDAFIAAEKELIQLNEVLGIFESLDIASKLFEKDNATAELINLYTTESVGSLLNNEISSPNLVSN